MGVITLAALSAGIITFPASVAIVMGANIGTTFTPILAAIGEQRIKQQVALGQVLFNLFSALVGIVLFWPLIRLVNDLL